MGANISNLTRATRNILRSVWRSFDDWYFDHNLRLNIGLPSTERPLRLRNGVRTSSTTTQWHSLEVICCEQGTECRLYIYVYNEQNTEIIYSTIYQNTATSPNSSVEVFWTNPRTGSSDSISLICPVEARAIRNLFI